MRVVVLVALAAGCGPRIDFTPRAEQKRALQIAWTEILKAPGRAPSVGWVVGDCGGWTGFQDGSKAFNTAFDDHGCAAGEEHGDGSDAWIALGWNDRYPFKFWKVPIGHELLHALIGDPNHDRPEWSATKTGKSLPGQVDDALFAADL